MDPISFLAAFALSGDPALPPPAPASPPPVVQTGIAPGRLIIVDPPPAPAATPRLTASAPDPAAEDPATTPQTQAPAPGRLCTCDHDGACSNASASAPSTGTAAGVVLHPTAPVVRRPASRAPAARTAVRMKADPAAEEPTDDPAAGGDPVDDPPPDPPPPPPQLPRRMDAAGQWWQHPDDAYLAQWIAGRNAMLAATQAASPFVPRRFDPPMGPQWQAQPNWGRLLWGGMFRGGSSCGPGGCP